jgi:hypothetical protein
MTSSTSPSRRRGAPRGNKNAYKHGFYSRQFPPADLAGASPTSPSGLQDEIAMLRLFMRRLIRLGAASDDLELTVDMLRVLCLAASSLNRLVRTQHLIFTPDNEFQLAMSQALQEVMQEMNIDAAHPLPPRPIHPTG